MNTKYEDYYSQHINTHNKARIALDIAFNKGVSTALSKEISELIEKVNRSKINGDNDNIVNTYNNGLNDIEIRLTSLYNFAQQYANAEFKYAGLSTGLDELYSVDLDLKEKIKKEPKEHMYKIKTEDGEIVDYIKYNTAHNLWKRQVISIKTDAKNLSDSVVRLISYLESINKLNPMDFYDNGNFPVFSSFITFDDYLANNIVESYYLEGDELKDFIDENLITNPDNAKILKRTVNVNGVLIDTYSVYNNNANEYDTYSFNKYISDSIYTEELIDPRILQSIFNGDKKSSIIFIQDEDQEFFYKSNHVGPINAAAYYNPGTNNITMLYYQGTPKSIIHETGHAFDYLLGLRYNFDGYYSHTKWTDIIKNEANYFDESNNHKIELRLLTDMFTPEEAEDYLHIRYPNIKNYEIVEEDGDWRFIVSNENPIDPNGVTASSLPLSGYNLTDYQNSPTEYFADVFQAFWMGDYNDDDFGISKLEYLCPKTYEAMYNLINDEINRYN